MTLDPAAAPPSAAASRGLASPRRRWAVGIALALVLAVAFYRLAMQRVMGDVFSSYPIILLDGFDWLLEGHAVAALASCHGAIDLPLLRNPVYVLCIAADAGAGGSGRVLFAVHAIALFLQVVLVWAACELLETDLRLQLATPLLLTLGALGALRFAIYPDDLAIVFLLAAFLALLLWRRSGRALWLVALGAASWLGALTQEYAAMPLVAAALLDGLGALRHRRRPSLPLLATCAAAGVAYLAARLAWDLAIPHRFDRDVWAPFSGQVFSLAQALGGEVATWLHVFWPLAGLLLGSWALFRRAAPERRATGTLVATLLALFALLTVAYRWPDPRHTYLMIPFVLLGCCAAWTRGAAPPFASRSLSWLASPLLATVLWVAQGVGLVHPFAGLVGRGASTALPAALAIPVDDRYDLAARCGSPRNFCPAAAAPTSGNPYLRVLLCEYRALKVQGVVGICGGLENVPNVRPARRRFRFSGGGSAPPSGTR